MDLTFLTNLGLTVIPNARLANFTTFQLGGSCAALLECHNAQELTVAVTTLRTQGVPFLVMGFGSNILASDQGVNRIIVRYSTDIPLITLASPKLATVICDAAIQLDDLVNFAVEHGLEGLTIFSGIPGTLGGAIAGNAGAYGQQISDILKTVALLKPDNTVVKVPRSKIHFEYRDSELKHSGDIILSATLALTPGGSIEAMRSKREETIATRESKHGRWQDSPCAGSFFRNVEPTSKAGPRQSAGWFLDEAGGKAMNINGAHSYPKHANIITRENEATAQDVYDLTQQMAQAVKEKFGLELIREVRLLGPFDRASACDPEGYW